MEIHKQDRVEVFISLFTSYGKENAIKRCDLTQKCVDAGLIRESPNKDRAMRKLLERARIDYKISITNDGDGEGYYLPTKEEAVRLSKNNKREYRKAISTFRSSKINKALEDDFSHGRIN